jgi:hypothetical protein
VTENAQRELDALLTGHEARRKAAGDVGQMFRTACAAMQQAAEEMGQALEKHGGRIEVRDQGDVLTVSVWAPGVLPMLTPLTLSLVSSLAGVEAHVGGLTPGTALEVARVESVAPESVDAAWCEARLLALLKLALPAAPAAPVPVSSPPIISPQPVQSPHSEELHDADH